MKFIKLLLAFLFTIAILTSETNAQTEPEDPRFIMTVRNITTVNIYDPHRDSILQFEIWLQQINQGQPGVNDFEYGGGQFTWTYNRAIQGTGNLFFSLYAPGCELPPSLRPPAFQVDSINGYLKMAGNLPLPSENFFISGTYPGTKILTARLRTSLHVFPILPLNLRFKLGSSPNTMIGYFLPYPDSVDSEQSPSQQFKILTDTINPPGTPAYLVEDQEFVMPVELASFTADVNRNNVTLKWTTSTETNNQGFDIERSLINSDEWSKAGNISGHGTTTESKSYSFSERLTTGKYIYRLKQIDFNGGVNYHTLNNEVAVGIPSAYALSQNYPNPFNPTTKIDFEIPADGNVSIILYDISGREVIKLVNEARAAGYYTVQLNASSLASGMYFYRISSGNFVATKKMVVLK